jgi:hypothetical protein
MSGSKPGERRGGRKKGSRNKAANKVQAPNPVGVSMLDIMVAQARWAHEEAPKILEAIRAAATDSPSAALAIYDKMVSTRDYAAKWAKQAASFFHPQLAAVAHRHMDADGSSLRPTVNVIIRSESGVTTPARIGYSPLGEAGPSPDDSRN